MNYKSVIFYLLVMLSFSLASCRMNATDSNQKKNGIELTRKDFLEKVHNYEAAGDWKYLGDKPCIVDFYALWCGPCRRMDPVLEELTEEYNGRFYLYKVNVDKEKALASDFDIRSIPTLVFVPMHGEPQFIQGTVPKEELKQIINTVLLK